MVFNVPPEIPQIRVPDEALLASSISPSKLIKHIQTHRVHTWMVEQFSLNENVTFSC